MPVIVTSFLCDYPDLVTQVHPILNGVIDPSKIPHGSNKKIWWLGKCGHSWDDTPSHRTISGRNCPFCRGLRVDDTNSLKTKYPELAKEWHPKKNCGKQNQIARYSILAIKLH